MTVPVSKQKKIASLFQEGMSPSEIAKKTGTDYKTAKKYAGMSTTSQQPVTHDMSPKFAPSKPKRARDTTKIYADYENVYYRPVSVAPPSGRGLGTVTDAKPLVPVKPLTKIQTERKNFKKRKWLPVGWVKDENERRHALNAKIQHEEEREKKNTEHRIKCSNAVNEIRQTINEKQQAKERENFERDMTLEQNRVTREGVREAIHEVSKIDEAKQQKIAMAYRELRALQNGEVCRVKKKQINDKFVGDVAPSVLGFLDDVVKSVFMISSKPKIFKAQLVKKPMQARVIK